MNRLSFLLLSLTVFLFPCTHAEENFCLYDSDAKETLCAFGSIDEPFSPCSTFKIAFALMGFDSGILVDASSPCWEYKEGYDCFLDSWKSAQTPLSWMKLSCVWYSRLLASQIGCEQVQQYLSLFNYGNQDISGGLTRFWLSSSLNISVREQAMFIHRVLNKEICVSERAIAQTKSLLFIETLPGGERLFGKTGWDRNTDGLEIGWFVGWLEKGGKSYPFAYCNIQPKIDLARRIPRVKELIQET